MKPFEIPYNFDKQLINILYNIDPSGQLFHCIYCPPYIEDYISAKSNYIHHNNINLNSQQSITRQEYESHIKNIQKYFPDKLMLLLQQNNSCITEQLLFYYYSLGFNKFCVGNIQQAIMIRKLLPDSEIIGSITMKIMPTDLNNKDYEVFDGFVLWFPYNRNIDTIKTLPNKYKYILLVNCDCSIYCSGTHHWFASKEQEKRIQCPNKKYKFAKDTIIRIDPQDLSIFEPYVSYFKLQGREFTTNQIIKDIMIYSTNYNLLNPNIIIEESKYQNNNIDFLKKI